MWASTRCPFCSSTRNIALGSCSTTRPSTSMAPSFFAMPYTASSIVVLLSPCRNGTDVGTGSAISQRAPACLRPQQDGGRRERQRPLYSQQASLSNPPPGDGDHGPVAGSRRERSERWGATGSFDCKRTGSVADRDPERRE